LLELDWLLAPISEMESILILKTAARMVQGAIPVD
jgi:hypothetical protein